MTNQKNTLITRGLLGHLALLAFMILLFTVGAPTAPDPSTEIKSLESALRQQRATRMHKADNND